MIRTAPVWWSIFAPLRLLASATPWSPPRGKFLHGNRRITVSEYVQPRIAHRPTAPRSPSGYGRLPVDDGAVRRRPPRFDHGAGSDAGHVRETNLPGHAERPEDR